MPGLTFYYNNNYNNYAKIIQPLLGLISENVNVLTKLFED